MILVEFEETGSNLFHPEFLMKHLPDVPKAKLPVPEKAAIQKTMKDYMASIQSPILRSVEKVTKQLKTPVKIKQEPVEEENTSRTVEIKRETPMKSKMNLLERVSFK